MKIQRNIINPLNFKKIKSYLNVLIMIILPFNCFSQSDSIDYLGQTPPNDIPKIFAPGFISLYGRLEQGISFSPDGKELLFGVVSNDLHGKIGKDCIYYTLKKDQRWSVPVIASFIGTDSVFFPMFSPDGNSLTYSRRHTKCMQTDIWKCNKTNNGWTVPELFTSPINSKYREGSSGLTKHGTLYFTSNRDTLRGCCGDIFRSKLINGKYLNVEILDILNTADDEEGLFISPADDYIIIQSWQVKYHSKHDLYISYSKFDGTWSIPVRLDSTVNTTDLEQRPFVSPDKKYLFFNRMALDKQNNPTESDFYWVSTKKLFKPYLFHPISDTIIIKSKYYKFKLPMNTFKDVLGRQLSYQASLSNGNPLPDWIEFDSSNQIFSGIPNSIEKLQIKIIVSAENHYTGSTEFKVEIKEK